MSYPNPPAHRAPGPRHTGRYVAGGLAVAVLAMGGVGAYVAQKTYFRPATFTMNDTFAGYERVELSQSPDLERYVATWAAAAAEDDKPTVSGMYRLSRGDTAFLVHLAARPGFVGSPAERVNEGFDGWRATMTFTESIESRDGKRSPFLLCATGKEGKAIVVPAVFCAYADNGGYLVGVFDKIDLSTAVVAFQEIRDSIEDVS
ncbi:hypothetical protein F4553_004102 [Allocatelliglobosispora scoriae]|uniref:Uncharacterized protein n=1 Tax=Allocatelliglobosispora scoriae TaxID=643052 RepID=A0A841BUY4_9ACTN|nr:hypothetical protein [Allocatelliglobosispora scoriae]MBB5870723.1 hypothetical protein [Allocatelliglobosispora scoriae]